MHSEQNQHIEEQNEATLLLMHPIKWSYLIHMQSVYLLWKNDAKDMCACCG